MDGFTFTVTEQKDLGSVGDASFGYHVTISDGTTDLEVMGLYMTKGNLLSHVEYAGSPDVEATKARAVLIAAGSPAAEAVIIATLAYVLSPDGRTVLLLRRDKRSDDIHFGRHVGLGGKLHLRRGRADRRPA